MCLNCNIPLSRRPRPIPVSGCCNEGVVPINAVTIYELWHPAHQTVFKAYICTPAQAVSRHHIPDTSSTPQLPSKKPQIESNRDHKALTRGTLGGSRLIDLRDPQNLDPP